MTFSIAYRRFLALNIRPNPTRPKTFPILIFIEGGISCRRLYACCLLRDAGRRGALFLDVLDRRSSMYHGHAAKTAPHVLKFELELEANDRKFPKPVHSSRQA
ncbi:hypothetical protein [Hyphomicrobium sp.]|jgi:hypothetical protein|uniref:hypothetical protein n=1 Tax=Hyphomicrobium sp. TaxID=82 RepID=UPI003561D826